MGDCDEGRNREKGETMRETREGDGNKIRKKGRGRGTLGFGGERGEGIATSGSLKESGINRQLRSSRREEM